MVRQFQYVFISVFTKIRRTASAFLTASNLSDIGSDPIWMKCLTFWNSIFPAAKGIISVYVGPTGGGSVLSLKYFGRMI